MRKRIKRRIQSIGNKRALLVYFLFILGIMLFASLLFLLSYSNKRGAEGETQFKTYYVRMDGGTDVECNGLANTAYPGSGTGLDCAFKHPFFAIPPKDVQPAYTTKITGGDTLIIGSGSYEMGQNDLFPASHQYGNCADSMLPYCAMQRIPSGPDPFHPTRIIGEGWDTKTGDKPELWGSKGVYSIINLSGSNNVEVEWLEITDRNNCILAHPTIPCVAGQAYARKGIYAQDSTNVKLANLNIHGFASIGIHAGRLSDWVLDGVRIANNGSAGWDGDLGDSTGNYISSNSGTTHFKNSVIEWNGCGETYPEGQPSHCWSYYGDGLGTGKTGGDWIFEDTQFLHNTSDGLDLLYHPDPGHITLKRVRSEGNAGNAIKVQGSAIIENSVMIANCDFFNNKEFTEKNYESKWGGIGVDNCRASGGEVLALVYRTGYSDSMYLLNNTMYAGGDGIISPGNCNTGNEVFVAKNNIMLGGEDFWDKDRAYYYYTESCRSLNPIWQNNIYYDGKLSSYQPSTSDKNLNPLLLAPTVAGGFDMHLSETSPAINAGTPEGAPLDDYASNPRVGGPDIGAYEYVSPDTTAPVISLASSYTDYVGYPIVIEPIASYADDYTWSVTNNNNVTDPITFNPTDGRSKNTTITASTYTGKDQNYQIKLRALNTVSTKFNEKTTNIYIHKLADINGDNSINFTDFSFLLSNWGTSTNSLANIVRTGTSATNVDFQDFSVLLSKWGS